MKIVVLNKADIKKVFTMDDAIQADKDALAIYSRHEADIPLRTRLEVGDHEGVSLFMPGYVAGANALGAKILSVYPNNILKGLPALPATMILMNETTGEVCAIIDGTYLTKLRTGAVAGAGTDLLSRKDAEIFALIGAGGQAETQVEAILTVRNIREVRVFDRVEARATALVSRMTEDFAGKFPTIFVQVDHPDAAVQGADIITCVTSSKTPVFDGRLVKEGAHINGIGSYTPDMQEIDEYTILNADKVYVDTRDGVLSESGDFISLMQKNKFSARDVTGELGEIILGQAPARASDEEITLFKSVGTGVLDLVTARRIYERAVQEKIGQNIEM